MAAEPTARGVALDPTERRVGLALAGLAAVAFVVIALADGAPARLVLGIPAAIVLGVAVERWGRKVAAAISVIVAVGPWWGFFLIFGSLYLAFAFWLLMRGRRASD